MERASPRAQQAMEGKKVTNISTRRCKRTLLRPRQARSADLPGRPCSEIYLTHITPSLRTVARPNLHCYGNRERKQYQGSDSTSNHAGILRRLRPMDERRRRGKGVSQPYECRRRSTTVRHSRLLRIYGKPGGAAWICDRIAVVEGRWDSPLVICFGQPSQHIAQGGRPGRLDQIVLCSKFKGASSIAFFRR
jgi:hypothetical protein